MPSIKNVDLRLRGMTVMFVLADTTTDKRQSTDISLISMQSAIRQSTGKGVIPSRQITGLQKSVTKNDDLSHNIENPVVCPTPRAHSFSFFYRPLRMVIRTIHETHKVLWKQ